MKRIRIDFAPSTVARTVQTTSFITWLLLLAAVCCWLLVAVKSASLIRQKDITAMALERVTEQVQMQLAARAAKKQAASQFTIPEAHANAVNHAIAQLNLPWRDLFDAMESATPGTIALLAVEPDAKKHTVKGTAEARTSDDMIGYLELLKKQPLFVSVLLTKHEINEQDPNRPVRFQFEAGWAGVPP